MPFFVVEIQGDQVPRRVDGAVVRMGFITCRVVEADHAEDAGILALEVVRDSPQLADSVPDAAGPVPMVEITEIHEVPAGDAYPLPDARFHWFPQP